MSKKISNPKPPNISKKPSPPPLRFWDKVMRCKHENLSDYIDGGNCGTPYCEWWESRCLDCGVYITKCGCMSNNGMSGWPYRRWLYFWRKKDAKGRRVKSII